jgi:hypothetical protein
MHTDQQAIHIALISTRCWQVEWPLQFLKAELALESPRLLIWKRRDKLMALAFHVYGWFVSLLVEHHSLVHPILEAESHRTGQRTWLTRVSLSAGAVQAPDSLSSNVCFGPQVMMFS